MTTRGFRWFLVACVVVAFWLATMVALGTMAALVCFQ
jgi:hypothetical protein